MTRLEILQQICNRDINKSLADSQLGLMWVADALVAMRRFGELAWNESRNTLDSNKMFQITFNEWLKEEEQKNG